MGWSKMNRYSIMSDQENQNSLVPSDKWRYTLYTTIIFLIVVNPCMYKFVQYCLGGLVKIANKDGCPTWAGIIVHAIVFTLILRGIMEFNI